MLLPLSTLLSRRRSLPLRPPMCPRPHPRRHARPVPPRCCLDSAHASRPVPTPLLCPLDFRPTPSWPPSVALLCPRIPSRPPCPLPAPPYFPYAAGPSARVPHWHRRGRLPTQKSSPRVRPCSPRTMHVTHAHPPCHCRLFRTPASRTFSATPRHHHDILL
jgi:hypothetical protein